VVTLIDVDEQKVRRYLTEAFEEKKYDRIHSDAQQVIDRVRHRLTLSFRADSEDRDSIVSTASKSDSISDSPFVSPSLVSHQLSDHNSNSYAATPQLQSPAVAPDEVFFGSSSGQAANDEEKEITGKMFFTLICIQLLLATHFHCRHGAPL
jgi:hypothetical protein